MEVKEEESVLEQGSDAWHRWRQEGIGASDMPTILGVSPYRKIEDLLIEKVFGPQPEKEVWSFAMQRGHDLEKKARALYELRFNLEMPPALAIHPEFPFMRASLDGLNAFHSKILEIKCPNEKDHKQALEGTVPLKYYIQLQHQLFVTGFESCDYFSFRQNKGVLVTVYPDSEMIERLVKEGLRFWTTVRLSRMRQAIERNPVTDDEMIEIKEWMYQILAGEMKAEDVITILLKRKATELKEEALPPPATSSSLLSDTRDDSRPAL